MEKDQLEILKIARSLGYPKPDDQLYTLRDWLRESHDVHIEIGSIWDEKTNFVESYIYTVTVPIHKFHLQPQCSGNGKNHSSMLIQGVLKGLEILGNYEAQKHLEVGDDELVVAYLKGYGEKGKKCTELSYKTNIEKYAYNLGKQGNYIEEGLTDDDIVDLVRNPLPQEEQLKLK